MEAVVMFIFMLGVPGYFVAQPVALMRWRGGWWKAALAPLALTAPTLVFSLVSLSQGSNLWPLTLVFAAALGSVYLSALWAAQRLMG
jgi:hypothetical protein